jgi:hypothetical protein
MPVIAVNVASKLFSEITDLVQGGAYASPEQFLEIAAFNQLALEKGMSPSEVIARGHRSIPESDSLSEKQVVATNDRSVINDPAAMRRPAAVGKRKGRFAKLPESDVTQVIERLTLSEGRIVLPKLGPNSVQPPSEHIWGQVNRLFPLKLACRWLAVHTLNLGDWSKYDQISDKLAEDAATLGSAVEHLDQTGGRKRDALLATGLPRRGNLASMNRFLSQFVARATRAGDIYPGALCQYALASFRGDQLVLTESGLEFAQIRNPLLDERLEETSSLSQAEKQFLVRQVRSFVPGELSDFVLLLTSIKSGKVSPSALLASVRESLPSEWSELMVRTHVSGLTARLADVGLIGRAWEGRNVAYQLGDGADPLILDFKLKD